MNKKNRKTNNKNGYSLVEMIVAISIFSIIMTVATGIFLNFTRSQQNSIASQTVQESLKFVFGFMSKEIRSARGTHTGSPCHNATTAYYKVFNNENNNGNVGQALYFENKYSECVVYERVLDGAVNRIQVSRDGTSGFITPSDINVSRMDFYIADDEADDFHATQARVVMVIEAEMNREPRQPISMQTTISSRYYE